MNRKALRQIFLDTLPVMTGYLVLGIGFGVLLDQQADKGFLWSAATGIFLFAGSAQYLLVSLIASGAPIAPHPQNLPSMRHSERAQRVEESTHFRYCKGISAA